MKKYLALLLVLMMALCLFAGCGDKPAEEPAAEPAAEPATEPADAEPAAEGTYLVTFSTGETYELAAGEDLVFFFQCDAPGDLGAPNPGEEGAGITVSEGTVTYSNVGTGGPNSFPTCELVTVSGITGDVTVAVTDAALAMDATHSIYFDQAQIDEAIAFAEEMAAQMAANPMPSGDKKASGVPSGDKKASGVPSGDKASGAPSGDKKASGVPSGEKAMPQVSASGDFEITANGVSGVAHYEDTDNGDQATKGFTITFDGKTIEGAIDKGVWTATSGDAADQAVVEAVKAAFEGGNVVGPAA